MHYQLDKRSRPDKHIFYCDQLVVIKISLHGTIYVTPLPLFIELTLHKSPMNNWQVEYFYIKGSFWNSLISNVPNVQQNFGVKVYEIESFFYVFKKIDNFN